MRSINHYILTTVLLFILLLAGCTRPDNTAEMWTNLPEMAAYAEEFNAEQDEYRVKVVFRENPAKDLLKVEVQPDLVLDFGLNSQRFIPLLEDLSPLFDVEKGTLDYTDFYQSLLEKSKQEELLLTLPISFNLPALYYQEGTIEEEAQDNKLTHQQLQNYNRAYNEKSKSSFPLMSFAPRWDGHYIYTLGTLQGSEFHETSTGTIDWNSSTLEETKTLVQEWTDEINGGFDDERAFTEKYLYQPGFKLVQNGRVQFQSTTLRDFYTIPPRERENFSLLWVSDENKIPVCTDVLFAGIPQGGEDKGAAKAFLSWFFQSKTQAALLESSQYKRIRGFGIAQGLSSLIHINELKLPQFYPLLVGKIPAVDELIFPAILPVEWEKVRQEVVIPWLLEDATPNGAEQELTLKFEDWYLQNPMERH